MAGTGEGFEALPISEVEEKLHALEQKGEHVFDRWDKYFAEGYSSREGAKDKEDILKCIHDLSAASERILGVPVTIKSSKTEGAAKLEKIDDAINAMKDSLRAPSSLRRIETAQATWRTSQK